MLFDYPLLVAPVLTSVWNGYVGYDPEEKALESTQRPNDDETKRTKSEAKLLKKAKLIEANVPKIINQDNFNLEIEFINGDRLSETLNSDPIKYQLQIMQKLGIQVITRKLNCKCL